MEKLLGMLKKRSFIIGIAVVVMIFVIVLIFFFSDGDLIASFGASDGVLFREEYEKLNGELTSDGEEYPKVNISSNNVTKYSNIEEIVSLFNNEGDAVVYFGYAECLYCRSAVQVLYDVAKTTELDILYYLDVSNQGEEYNTLYEKLGDELVEEEDNGNKVINAPLVIFIANGRVVSYNKGTLFSQESPYIPLDEWQVYGLSEIYQYGINDVLTSINNKKEAASQG